MSAMLSCPRCGAANPEFDVVCSTCGAELATDLCTDGGEARRAAGPPIASGARIASYVVEDQIGEGGMGTVYLARDVVLGRAVALKFLARHLAADPQARARFVREARAASALDHPNVGVIYQVGEHEGVPYLAMPFYDGMTLRERLNTAPLAIAEVERTMRCVAAGIGAAHAAGIVHRDVKPGNLLLLDGQVKVLDFGLAKPAAGRDDEQLTDSGQIVGTVQYMAPEQLRGAPADPRVDVWALGVIAYEMLSGKHPFAAATSADTIARILDHEPAPIASLRADTPSPLAALVMRCLRKAAAERPGDAAEFLQALDRPAPDDALSDTVPTSIPAIPPLRRTVRRRWALGLAVAIAALGAGAMVLRFGPLLRGGHGIAHDRSGRRSVAILGFKNVSNRPDAAWLSTALSEMLATEMSSGAALRVISGEDVARMRAELALTDSDALAADTLALIRNNLGVDLVVLGAYISLDESIRLDLRIQDAQTGEIVMATAETGTTQGLFDLVTRAGARARQRLGVAPLPSAEASAVRAALPEKPQAARAYAEGLASLRRFDPVGAREQLERAVAYEPGFPLAHSALAEALTILGYDAEARDEAKRAFDGSSTLSREERLLVEGRYRETANEWDRAIEVYRTLVDFFPDRVDYALRLASAQSLGGKGADALATLSALRTRAHDDDPRIDLAEWTARDALGDYRGALAAAQKASRVGEARGARLLHARARQNESWALTNLGQLDASINAADAARTLLLAAGDRLGAALTLNVLAANEYHRGHYAASIAFEAEAKRLTDAVGAKQWGVTFGVTTGQSELGRGNLDEALRLATTAVEGERAMNNKPDLAGALIFQGMAQMARGDHGGAKLSVDDGVRLSVEVGDRRITAWAYWARGDLLLLQGHVADARRDHETALATREQERLEEFAAESRLALARVALAEQHPEAAEGLARAALAKFESTGAIDKQVLARAALSAALLGVGHIEAALHEAEAAMKKCEDTDGFAARHAARLALARARAASSADPAESIDLARAASRDAARAGFVAFDIEARLVTVELQKTSAERTALLGALAREARSKGLGLLADEAQRAAR